MMNPCPNCSAATLFEEAEFCLACGFKFRHPGKAELPEAPTATEIAIIAALLSVEMPDQKTVLVRRAFELWDFCREEITVRQAQRQLRQIEDERKQNEAS
jgi:hypothetical protein